MAAPTDIPAPLSDRTLAHGRNTMAAAGVILVLAWVPGIEITDFEPLGFDISDGQELSIWFILAGLLVYYATRFGFDCWVDYSGWIDTYKKAANAHPTSDVFNRHARRLKAKYWFLDVAPPAIMLLAALGATFQRVVPLVQVVPLVTPPSSSPLFAAITTTPQFITIGGLALDILGVLFLAFFPIRAGGSGFLMLEGPASFSERHPWLRWVGLPAIVFGFLLQIIGNLAEVF